MPESIDLATSPTIAFDAPTARHVPFDLHVTALRFPNPVRAPPAIGTKGSLFCNVDWFHVPPLAIESVFEFEPGLDVEP